MSWQRPNIGSRRGDRMTTRREFITLLGTTAAVWPLTTHAQQQAMPLVGFRSAGVQATAVHLFAAFRQSLGEAGYVEGRNLGIEYRFAEGQYNRLPDMAAELVRRQPALIVATPTPAAVAAKAATA